MKTVDLIRACLGVYVDYSTQVGRQLANYIDIRHELTSLATMSEYYSHKCKEFWEKYQSGGDPNRAIQPEDILPITAMATHIVIAYSRCFDSAKSKRGQSVRRLIKLNRDFLRDADPRILATHDKLLELRNSMVAHAGENEFESHRMIIGLNKNGETEIKPAEDNRRVMSIPYAEYDEIEPLVTFLTNRIDEKFIVLTEKLKAELDILTSAQKGDHLVRKLYARQSITEEDLRID